MGGYSQGGHVPHLFMHLYLYTNQPMIMLRTTQEELNIHQKQDQAS